MEYKAETLEGSGGFLAYSVVKNLTAKAGDTGDAGSIPDQEDPLKAGMAAQGILVWRIPWLEKPGRLQFIESQTVVHN